MKSMSWMQAVVVLLAVSLEAGAAALTWDANTSSNAAQDGAGSWDTTGTNWWTGAANTFWNNANPDAAVFGNGGTGGVVSITENVIVTGVTFNAVSGTNTYTISGATLTMAESVASQSIITMNAAAMIDAVIAGNGFRKAGNSTLFLGGANTFTGAVLMTGGILTLTNGFALGSSPLVTVGNGQKLRLSGNITVTGTTVSINGNGGNDSSGALQAGIYSTNEWAGGVVMAGDVARIGANTGATLVVSGVIAHNSTAYGLGIRNCDMSGWVVLRGENTYSGKTWLVLGRMKFDGGDNRLPVASLFDIGNSSSLGGALMDMNGFNQQISGLTDQGGGMSKVITNSSATLSTLTIIGTNTYSTANGTVLAGNFALVKGGTGTQILRGAVNTYSGGTTINGGTLALGTDGANNQSSRGLGNGPVAINAGGTLRLGGNTAGTTFTITNAVTIDGGTIWAQEGIQHFTNSTFAVGAGGGSLITVNGEKDLWIDHAVSGSGPLTVDNAASTTGGTATVRFTSVASTYDGTVTVNGPGAGFLGGRIAIYGNTPLANATVVMNGTNSMGFGSLAPVIGALAGSGNIVIPATYSLSVGNNGSNTTYSGVLGGSGTFTKLGSGVQTLAANNVITGTVNVTGGTLALAASGSLSNSPVVTGAAGTFDVTAFSPFVVPAGEPLMGNGTVSGMVVVVNAGSLVPGGNGSAGTLTVAGSLAVDSSYTNVFDLSTPGTIGSGVNDLLVVNGGFEPSGSVVRINQLVPLSNGTYRLVNYSGAKTTSFNPVPAGNDTHKTWTINESTIGQVDFVLSGTYGNLRWNPVTSTNWDLVDTNWFDMVTLQTNNFLNLDSVLFDDNGAFSPVVNLAATVQPATIVVNSTSNYNISGPGKISGSTGLTKDGPGTLTLGGTGNNFTGPVVITNGILKVATDTALGATNAGTIINGGTLDINGLSLNQRDNITIFGNGYNNTGTIINSGAAQDQGIRSLTLGSDASVASWTANRWSIRGTNIVDLAGYTLTKLGGGQLFIVEMTMTNAGNICVASGTLSFARGVTSGDGVIGVAPNAALTLENYTAGFIDKSIALTNAALRLIGNSVVTTARVSVTGISTVDVANTLFLGTIAPITGPGSLVKAGTGTMVCKSSNTYAGATTIASGGGTLILNWPGGPMVFGPVQLGTAIDGGGNTMLVCSNNNLFAPGVSIGFGGSPGDFAWLKLVGTTQYLDSIASDDNSGGVIDNAYQDNGVASDALLVISGAGNSIFSGRYMRDSVSPSTSTGKLRVQKDGSGTLTLAGAGSNMTFSGGVIANSGTLNLKANGSAGIAPVVMAGGVLSLDGAGFQEGWITTNAIDLVSTNPLNSGVKLSTKRANLVSDFATTTMWMYSGYIVVTNPTGVTYTFAENLDDSVNLRIDGTTVLNNGVHNQPTLGTIALSPGLHRFDLRVHNNTSGGGPTTPAQWWTNALLGVGYDPLGRGETNLANYQAIADAGDGLLFCTDVTITNGISLLSNTQIKVSNAIGPTNSLTGTIGDGGANLSVTKTGDGILRFAGNNTYGGATVVSAGTLLVDGFNLGTGALTVQTNASLWGTGTVLMASVTIDAGGQIGPRSGTATGGTFTVTNLTINSGATFNALLNGAVPTIHALGDVTVSPTISVKITSVAPMSVGTNVLLDYDGIFTGSIGDFSLGVLPNGAQGYLENNILNSSIDLIVTNAGLGIKWDGGVNGVWDVAGAANWKSILSGASAPFSTMDNVSFDDTAAGNFDITLSQSVTVASFAISNETQNYSFSGGGIGGSIGITKYGAAKLSLLNANYYTGATVVAAGTLAIASDSSLGVTPSVSTTQLFLNAGTTLEAVTNVTISATRRIAIGTSGSAGSATLNIATGSTVTASSIIADATGATGAFVKVGAGNLTLTAFNTYSGGTILDGGLIQLPTAGGTGGSAIPKRTPLTVQNGATLRLVGGTAIGQDQSITGGGNPSVVTVSYARVTTVANTHQDTPQLVLRGAYISSEGPGDQYGNYIQDGSNIIVLADAQASVIDAVSFNPRGGYGGSGQYVGNFIVEDGAAEHDLLVTAQIMDFPGTVCKVAKTGPGMMTIATAPSTNIYSGWTLINEGTLMLGTNNIIAMPRGPITNNARLVMNMAGGIVSNSIDGTGVVVNAGTGVITLLANNTSSGGTQISNGTLIVNGTLGAGAVTIAAGATLAGTGTINGAVTSDGVVSPGTSAGLLTMTQSYTQNVGAALNIEIGGSSQPGVDYDQLLVTGAATLGGTLNITLTNGFVPAVGDQMIIMQASSLSGTFATTNLPSLGTNLWTVEYFGDSLVLLSVTNGPPGGATGYDAWAAQIVNGQTNFNDSALGDGYPNLLKYATGSNPTNADGLAKMNRTTTNGAFALKFTRNTNATDVTLIIEGSFASTNEATWNGIATNIHGSWGATTNYSENTTTDPASVVVWDTATATNRFLRLRVTRP